jgi:thiol-disulfide isomerase/thioredoxin
VTSFERGKVYVVECWATWCGPCATTMPHLTRLQDKLRDKGVVVVGVSVWEDDPAAPAPFVKKMGDRIGYAVATDQVSAPGEEGRVSREWLQAAGRTGIPSAFLIDRNGRIAWVGSALVIDRPLALLADDKFDPKQEERFEAESDALFEEYAKATDTKDNARALAALDKLRAHDPTMAPQYGVTKAALLIKTGDYAAANALAASVAEEAARDGDESLYAVLANTLANAPEPGKADAALALRLAQKAYAVNGNEGWQHQGLLARTYALNRQFDRAVEWQTRAIEGAPAAMKDDLRPTLEEYRRQQVASPK